MDKNLQNIEDLFKKGLEGNEESPSEEVWNAIDQSLEKANSLKFRKKYYTLKRATAILIVMLALLSIYILRNDSQKQPGSKSKNKNVVTSEPAPKNGIIENQQSPTEKINKAPVENQENNTPPKENLTTENEQAEISKTDSQQSGSSAKNIRAETAISSKAPAYNKVNKKISEANKPAEEITTENIAEVKKSPSLSPIKQRNETALQQPQKQVIAPAPIIFNAQDILSFNDLENLKNAKTISSYNSPSRIVSKTPIHIPGPPRWFATIFYSPNIAFSHLRDEDHSSNNSYSRELEKNEKGSYSYSFGVLVDYRLNNKFSLQSGISLSTIKMNLEPEKIYAERDNQGNVKYQINTSSGKGYILPSFSSNPRVGDSLFTDKIKHSLQYTSIPLAAKYYVTNNRLSINLVAGFSTNILSQGKISTEVNKGNEREHEKTHDIHGLRSLYFSGLTGIGFNYNIYRNLSLNFSPTINFAIDPINKNTPVNSYPGTINFQLGIKAKL